MNLQEIISNGGTLVYDPTLSTLTPDEFLSLHGDTIEAIGIMAKSEAGSTYYTSSTAPKDPRYGELFASFTQIATDIGIDVYALMHGNVDGFISRDPNFKMYRSGGDPIESFVCPNQENYWFYLSEIAAEIASKSPVAGIILTDMLYPRDTTCFCDNCKRTFSQDANISRDFSHDYLNKRPDILNEWRNWRITAIRSMLSSLINRVHQERKLEVITEILIDPQTNYFKGALEHFGHDLASLTQVSSHILLHFYPWSPFPSTDGEIDSLVSNMTPIIERMSNSKNSLFMWEPTDENFPFIRKLGDALRSQFLFFTEQPPRSYLNRRTLHLQLSM